MKHTRIAALAAVGVAATLSLTACGNGGSGNDSSSKGSSSSSSSSSDGGSASEGDSGNSAASAAQSGSGKDTEARAGAASGATKTGGKATFCKTEDLAIDAKDAAPDESSGRIDVTMINRGSRTCSATGFAGVDIKDVDHTSSPLTRAKAEPRVTTLQPGDAAVFNLAYDIDRSGESHAHPTHLQVTPPNETHTVNLKWPAGAGEIKGAYPDVEVYPTHTTK